MQKEFYLVELLFTTMYIKFFSVLTKFFKIFLLTGLEKAKDNPSEFDKLDRSIITLNN